MHAPEGIDEQISLTDSLPAAVDSGKRADKVAPSRVIGDTAPVKGIHY